MVFLGALAALRKATVSFVMSVRFVFLSARMEQLGFHWTEFYEIWCLGIFRKSVQKIQVWLVWQDKWVLNLRPVYNYNYTSLRCSYNENCFGQKFRANQNTHFMFYNVFSRKSRRLWDNVSKYGRARQAADANIIRCLCVACWITNAII